jgi:hypothetical protein
VTVLITVVVLPARSVAVDVIVYIRPDPVPRRSAPSWTVRGPNPLPVITTCGLLGSDGSEDYIPGSSIIT